MDFLSEFRRPTRWYSKLLVALLALSFFTLLALGAIGAYVVYRIVAPVKTDESVDLASLPGHPGDFSYAVEDLGLRDSWFFPGLKSAPTIVLCSAYLVGREELLPLATALQDHGYNVLLFDFAGHGRSATYSTLGFRETRELRAAVSAVAERDDVDRSRFGFWGTDLGAYAAVAVAESDPRIRALAVESVYDRPQDLLGLLLTRYGLPPLPLLRRVAEKGFLWFNYTYRGTPPLSRRLARLGGTPKIFLEAADVPALAASTRELFLSAPAPKQEALLTQGNYAGMLDEEKRSYENRIISFFLLNLPP
jgi:pimeloyl-ACP methyl ester carboxylesterase